MRSYIKKFIYNEEDRTKEDKKVDIKFVTSRGEVVGFLTNDIDPEENMLYTCHGSNAQYIGVKITSGKKYLNEMYSWRNVWYRSDGWVIVELLFSDNGTPEYQTTLI